VSVSVAIRLTSGNRNVSSEVVDKIAEAVRGASNASTRPHSVWSASVLGRDASSLTCGLCSRCCQ